MGIVSVMVDLTAGDAIARIFGGHIDGRREEESSGTVMAGLLGVEVRVEVEPGCTAGCH